MFSCFAEVFLSLSLILLLPYQHHRSCQPRAIAQKTGFAMQKVKLFFKDSADFIHSLFGTLFIPNCSVIQ
jgi:hypothetical protein